MPLICPYPCAHGISRTPGCTRGTSSAMLRWLGLGPYCYACSERARRCYCRLLRARFALSDFLTAGLESCLERLLCTSDARAAVCSSVRMERSVFPLTLITPRGPGILSLRYA